MKTIDINTLYEFSWFIMENTEIVYFGNEKMFRYNDLHYDITTLFDYWINKQIK